METYPAGAKKSKWLKAAAWFTVLIFTSTNIGLADLAALPQTHFTPTLPSRTDTIELQIPAEYGLVQRSKHYAGSPTVILLQDLHANEQAQRNAAEIVRYLSRHHGLKLIHVEGAEGKLFTELFHAFPDRGARKKIADYFLAKARLSGPEYAAVVDLPDWQLFGAEDGELYQKNREAYLQTKQAGGSLNGALQSLEKMLKDLSTHVFTRDVSRFVAHRRAFDRREKEFKDWVEYLVQIARDHGLAFETYPQVEALMQALAMEREIDFEKALNDAQAMEKNPEDFFGPADVRAFYEMLLQYRARRMPGAGYYGFLLQTFESMGRGNANFMRYLRYMELYSGLNAGLLDEIAALEENVLPLMAMNEEQSALVHLFQVFSLIEKMLEFRMTKADAVFYDAHRSDFSPENIRAVLEPLLKKYAFSTPYPAGLEKLEEKLAQAERYYDYAIQRDRALIGNTLKNLQESGEKITVLVAGGFHTPGMEALLRERRVSYEVVTPRVTRLDSEREGLLYDQAMRSKNLPLAAELLESFIAPDSVFAGDPSFQLQTPRVLVTARDFYGALAQIQRGAVSPEARTQIDQALELPVLQVSEQLSVLAPEELAEAISSTPGTPSQTHLFERAFGGFLHNGLFLELDGGTQIFVYPKAVAGQRKLAVVRAQVSFDTDLDIGRVTGLDPGLFVEAALSGGTHYYAASLDPLYLSGIRRRAVASRLFSMPGWPGRSAPAVLAETAAAATVDFDSPLLGRRPRVMGHAFQTVSQPVPVARLRSEVRVDQEDVSMEAPGNVEVFMPSVTIQAPVETRAPPVQEPKTFFGRIKPAMISLFMSIYLFTQFAWAVPSVSRPASLDLPSLQQEMTISNELQVTPEAPALFGEELLQSLIKPGQTLQDRIAALAGKESELASTLESTRARLAALEQEAAGIVLTSPGRLAELDAQIASLKARQQTLTTENLGSLKLVDPSVSGRVLSQDDLKHIRFLGQVAAEERQYVPAALQTMDANTPVRREVRARYDTTTSKLTFEIFFTPVEFSLKGLEAFKAELEGRQPLPPAAQSLADRIDRLGAQSAAVYWAMKDLAEKENTQAAKDYTAALAGYGVVITEGTNGETTFRAFTQEDLLNNRYIYSQEDGTVYFRDTKNPVFLGNRAIQDLKRQYRAVTLEELSTRITSLGQVSIVPDDKARTKEGRLLPGRLVELEEQKPYWLELVDLKKARMVSELDETEKTKWSKQLKDLKPSDWVLIDGAKIYSIHFAANGRDTFVQMQRERLEEVRQASLAAAIENLSSEIKTAQDFGIQWAAELAKLQGERDHASAAQGRHDDLQQQISQTQSYSRDVELMLDGVRTEKGRLQDEEASGQLALADNELALQLTRDNAEPAPRPEPVEVPIAPEPEVPGVEPAAPANVPETAVAEAQPEAAPEISPVREEVTGFWLKQILYMIIVSFTASAFYTWLSRRLAKLWNLGSEQDLKRMEEALREAQLVLKAASPLTPEYQKAVRDVQGVRTQLVKHDKILKDHEARIGKIEKWVNHKMPGVVRRIFTEMFEPIKTETAKSFLEQQKQIDELRKNQEAQQKELDDVRQKLADLTKKVDEHIGDVTLHSQPAPQLSPEIEARLDRLEEALKVQTAPSAAAPKTSLNADTESPLSQTEPAKPQSRLESYAIGIAEHLESLVHPESGELNYQILRGIQHKLGERWQAQEKIAKPGDISNETKARVKKAFQALTQHIEAMDKLVKQGLASSSFKRVADQRTVGIPFLVDAHMPEELKPEVEGVTRLDIDAVYGDAWGNITLGLHTYDFVLPENGPALIRIAIAPREKIDADGLFHNAQGLYEFEHEGTAYYAAVYPTDASVLPMPKPAEAVQAPSQPKAAKKKKPKTKQPAAVPVVMESTTHEAIDREFREEPFGEGEIEEARRLADSLGYRLQHVWISSGKITHFTMETDTDFRMLFWPNISPERARERNLVLFEGYSVKQEGDLPLQRRMWIKTQKAFSRSTLGRTVKISRLNDDAEYETATMLLPETPLAEAETAQESVKRLNRRQLFNKIGVAAGTAAAVAAAAVLLRDDEEAVEVAERALPPVEEAPGAPAPAKVPEAVEPVPPVKQQPAPAVAQQPAPAPAVQAVPAGLERAGGQPLLAATAQADRSLTLFKLDEGPNRSIRHHPGHPIPGVDGKDLFKDFHKDLERIQETITALEPDKALERRTTMFNRELKESSEIQLVRLYTELLGFDLPEAGWYENWLNNPNREPLEQLTAEQRAIVEGRLWTVEDWAQEFFIPMMREMGFLDPNLDDYRNVAAPTKEQENRAKARKQFLIALNKNLWWSMLYYPRSMPSGSNMARYQLMFSSLRLDSDQLSRNADTWVDIARSQGPANQGEFLLGEMMGFALDETVTEAANRWEKMVIARSQNIANQIASNNPIPILTHQMRVQQGIVQTIQKNLSNQADLRTFMRWGVVPDEIRNAHEQIANIQAKQVADYIYQFVMMLAVQTYNNADLMARRARLMNNHFDIMQRHQILGNYNLTRSAQGKVILPEFVIGRFAEHNLNLANANLFPWNESAHGSFRQQGYIEFFSLGDTEQEATELATERFAAVMEVIDELLTQGDLTKSDYNLLNILKGIAGNADFKGSNPIVQIEQMVFDYLKEAATSRAEKSPIGKEVEAFAELFRSRITVLKAQGREFPVYSDDAIQSLAQTAFDFYQSPIMKRIGTKDGKSAQEILVDQIVQLLDRRAQKDYESTYQSEMDFFFQPRGDWQRDLPSLLEMSLSGKLQTFFSVQVKNEDRPEKEIGAHRLKEAEKLVEMYEQYSNMSRIGPLYQDKLVIVLRKIKEAKENYTKGKGRIPSYLTRVKDTLAALLSGQVFPAEPAHLEQNLRLETQESRLRELYAELVGLTEGILLDHYKNDRFAILKEGVYDLVRARTERELEEAGYRLRYDAANQEEKWETASGVVANENEVRQFYQDQVAPLYDRATQHYAMRAALRKPLENLLGRKLNLSDSLFGDPAILSKLVSDSLDRNMRVNDMVWILQTALNLKNNQNYKTLLAKYLMHADYREKYYDHQNQQVPPILDWDFPARTVSQVMEDELGWRRLINVVSTGSRVVWQERNAAGDWRNTRKHDSDMQPIMEKAAQLHREEDKQTEILLGQVIADAESVMREGELPDFMASLSAIVEEMNIANKPLDAQEPRTTAHHQDALRITREYFNVKAQIMERPQIHPSDDDILSRPPGATVRPFLESIVRDSRKISDQAARAQHIQRDFEKEYSRQALLVELLKDHRRPKGQRKYEVNNKSALEEAFERARNFYTSIYPGGVNLANLIPSLAHDISQDVYVNDSRVEGLVNGFLLLGFDPDQMKKPGDAGYDDWARAVLTDSFDNAREIVQKTKGANGDAVRQEVLELAFGDALNHENWKPMQPAREAEEKAAARRAFEANLIFIPTWMGFYLDHWREKIKAVPIAAPQQPEDGRQAGLDLGANNVIAMGDLANQFGVNAEGVAPLQGRREMLLRSLAHGGNVLYNMVAQRSEVRSGVSRRDFLKTVGIGAVAASAVLVPAAAQAQAPAVPAAPMPVRDPAPLPEPPTADLVTEAQKLSQQAFNPANTPRALQERQFDLNNNRLVRTAPVQDGLGFELTLLENGAKRNSPPAGEVTLMLGQNKEVIVRLRADHAVLQLAGDEKQSTLVKFAELQTEAGRTLSGVRIKKVVVTTKPGDMSGVSLHVLYEGEHLTGAQHLYINPVTKPGTKQVTGKVIQSQSSLFVRKPLSAGHRVVPMKMETLYAGKNENGLLAARHDHVLVNYERKKGDVRKVFQTRVDLKNPERGDVVEMPGRADEKLLSVSLERESNMSVEPAVERRRSYRVDVLSATDTVRPRIVSRHTQLAEDVTSMQPNNSVILGFNEKARPRGDKLEFAFQIEEVLDAPAQPAIVNPEEEDIPPVLQAAMEQKFEEYIHHKKRIDQYIQENYALVARAAHSFYAALYKNDYKEVDYFFNPQDLNADKSPKAGAIPKPRSEGINEGLLRGFLYGAAAEIVSDDTHALNVWLRAAANMTDWFTQENLDTLAKRLSEFYKKPFVSGPNQPREEKGIFIAWARFFAEEDVKGRQRWWKGTVDEFFTHAKTVRESGISQLLYGKKEFNIDSPQDMGILINWARFIQKNGIERFKFAIEILKTSKAEWKQLSEGEIAFFVEYAAEILNQYDGNVTLKDIFSNIQKAQRARDKAVDQLTNDWFKLDLYWATEEDRAAILAIIKTNLAKQGLTQEKAVYLGSKHMLARAYSEEDLVDEIKQEVFYQAVYMHYQRDATGASMMLTDGELGELITRKSRERYEMETVGKLLKYEAMYRSRSGTMVERIEKGAEVRWTNPKNGAEETRFSIPALGRDAARALPTSSAGQVTGFATDMHEREMEYKAKLKREKLSDSDIGNRLRYWAQMRFDTTFDDILWLQSEEYQMAGRFLPWSIVSSFLFELRQEDYEPLNIVEIQRGHAKFQTSYRLNMVLMDLDRPGFEGNLLSFLWFSWKAISGEVLVWRNKAGELRPGDSAEVAERAEMYMSHLIKLREELAALGYSSGQIQGKQVEFLEKLNAVRRQSENLLGMAIDSEKPAAKDLETIRVKVDRLEKNIIERLRKTVVENDERHEQSRYVTMIYSTPNAVLSSGYEAQIHAERAQRAIELRRNLIEKPGFRQELFERLEQKVKNIQKGDARPDEADQVNFLISRVNILIDKMVSDGLSEEEVLEHYVRLNREIEQEYKKLFKKDPLVELLEDELGVTGYYAGPIARISGIDPQSPVLPHYEAALREARRATLETDIRRFKAEGESNPHARRWTDELQQELSQIDKMDLDAWKELEMDRLKVIFALARHIQDKFKEVDFELSDKEAQIMAYNAFAGSLREKNIDDWVAVIRNKIDLWLETVKELKSANPKIPMEEIMYYADQWLELHLADPLRVRDAGLRPEEREKARKARVESLRKQLFTLLQSRAGITLDAVEMQRLAEEVEHRGINLSTLAVLIDKARSLFEDIERIREFEKELPIDHPLKAAQQAYHLSIPLTMKDLLVYLDNLNTNPQVHVSLARLFGYEKKELDHLQIPINAAYRLEMLQRMRFAIPEQIWDQRSSFAKWVSALREGGMPVWSLALLGAYATTAVSLLIRSRVDKIRFEDTTRIPEDKLGILRPGTLPPHEQEYEPWSWNYTTYLFRSTYWIHFVVLNYMLTLDHTFFSPLAFTVAFFGLVYLYWPKVVLFIQARIMFYMAALRDTVMLPENEAATNPDGTIAEYHGLMTATGVPLRPGKQPGTMLEGDMNGFADVIRTAIDELKVVDDPRHIKTFALGMPPFHMDQIKAGDLRKPGGDALREAVRKDLSERRDLVFDMIGRVIDEEVKDPHMNASIRARIHPILRYTGYPKPEIWFEHFRFMVEDGDIITLDEMLGDDVTEKMKGLAYTQSEPRTNPATYLHMGAKDLPADFDNKRFSQPMAEMMDLTKDMQGNTLPQMRDLGAGWRDRYVSMEAIRKNFQEVRRTYSDPLAHEARVIRHKQNQLNDAVQAAGGTWTAAQLARKERLEKERAELDTRGGDLLFGVLNGEVKMYFPNLQILDVGNATTHHDMAALSRVMAANPAATYQALIKYRPDMAKQTLFSRTLQDFPQKGLLYTIIMQPFFFRHKEVSLFEKMLLFSMFPGFMAAGFGAAGWVGFLLGTIAAHLVLMWFDVSHAPGGDIRPGGKYAVKSFFAHQTLLRPFVGNKPKKKSILGDSFANLVRWLNTYLTKPGDPIGEDELVGLATSSTVLRLSVAKARAAGLSEKQHPTKTDKHGLQYVEYRLWGPQEVPNATVTEDSVANEPTQDDRKDNKWRPVFDDKTSLVRQDVGFKNQPYWMLMRFGVWAGGIVSVVIAGTAMPVSPFLYGGAILTAFFVAALLPVEKEARQKITRIMAFMAVAGLATGAFAFGSIHLGILVGAIGLTALVFFPLANQMKKEEAQGEMWPEYNLPGGRHYNDLAIRSQLGTFVWLLMLFISAIAVINPGQMDVSLPYMGEIIFKWTIITLIAWNTLTFFDDFYITKRQGKDTALDRINKNMQSRGYGVVSRTAVYVTGFIVSAVASSFIGFLQLIGSQMFMKNLIHDTYRGAKDWFFAIVGVVYRLEVIKNGSGFLDKLFTGKWGIYTVLQRGHPFNEKWKPFFIEPQNFLYEVYLWAGKLTIPMGLAALAVILNGYAAQAYVMGTILFFAAYYTFYSLRGLWLPKSNRLSITREEFLTEGVLSIGMLLATWFYIDTIALYTPVMLLARASTIVLGSFLAGQGISYLFGINLIKIEAPDHKGRMAQVGFIPDGRWWTDLAVYSIAIGASILALAGGLMLTLSGYLDFVDTFFAFLFAPFLTGDGMGMAGSPVPRGGAQSVLNLPWDFALFFNVIIGATFVLGVIGHVLGIAQTIKRFLQDIKDWLFTTSANDTPEARNLRRVETKTAFIAVILFSLLGIIFKFQQSRQETETKVPEKPEAAVVVRGEETIFSSPDGVMKVIGAEDDGENPFAIALNERVQHSHYKIMMRTPEGRYQEVFNFKGNGYVRLIPPSTDEQIVADDLHVFGTSIRVTPSINNSVTYIRSGRFTYDEKTQTLTFNGRFYDKQDEIAGDIQMDIRESGVAVKVHITAAKDLSLADETARLGEQALKVFQGSGMYVLPDGKPVPEYDTSAVVIRNADGAVQAQAPLAGREGQILFVPSIPLQPGMAIDHVNDGNGLRVKRPSVQVRLDASTKQLLGNGFNLQSVNTNHDTLGTWMGLDPKVVPLKGYAPGEVIVDAEILIHARPSDADVPAAPAVEPAEGEKPVPEPKDVPAVRSEVRAAFSPEQLRGLESITQRRIEMGEGLTSPQALEAAAALEGMQTAVVNLAKAKGFKPAMNPDQSEMITYYLLEVHSTDWDDADFAAYLDNLTAELTAQRTKLVLYNADRDLDTAQRQALFEVTQAWARAAGSEWIEASDFTKPGWTAERMAETYAEAAAMSLGQSVHVDLRREGVQASKLSKELVLLSAVELARQYGVVVASVNPVQGITQQITMQEIENAIAAYQAAAASA